MPQYVFDIETFPNYFLLVARNIENDKVLVFREDDLDLLRTFLKTGPTMIGFNNDWFDNLILDEILKGSVNSAVDIKNLSKAIIEDKTYSRDWRFKKPYKSIDLMMLHGGDSADEMGQRLKAHEVRLRMDNVIDLPYHFTTVLSDEQKKVVDEYCINDIEATFALMNDVWDEANVRADIAAQFKFLGDQVYNKRRSGIAEAIMKQLYYEKTGTKKVTVDRNAKSYDFDFENDIDDLISFTTEPNKLALDALKSIGVLDCSTIAYRHGSKGKKLPLATFVVGGNPLPVRLGGLHTSYPAFYKEGIITDFDVSSYYPSLLLRYGKAPKGRSQDWVDIVRSLTEKRMAYKNAGDKAKSAVYKIIINSLYGKLRSEDSINYDPSLLYKTTINGQLILVMACEALSLVRGTEIIAANTDGVTVISNDDDSQQRALDTVANIFASFGMEYEAVQYDKYVSLTINDYAAVKSLGGIKRKGSFLNSNNSEPMIIHRAVEDYWLKGVPVEDTVNQCEDVLDFCYAVAIKKDEVYYKGEKVQNVLRFAATTNGAPITRRKADGREDKVPNANQVSLALRLNEFDGIIDRQHYINEAMKRVVAIRDNVKLSNTKDDIEERLEKVRGLQALGLKILPKGTLRVAKENVPKTFEPETLSRDIEDWDWNYYRGFGAVVGPEHGLLVLDIDYPERAMEAGLFEVIKKSWNTIVSYHGKHTRKEVLSGECKGNIYFSYSGDELKPSTPEFLKACGFEVLYDRKVIQMDGYHDSWEAYSFSGSKLKEMPDVLKDYIMMKQGEFPSRASKQAVLQAIDYDAGGVIASIKEAGAYYSETDKSIILWHPKEKTRGGWYVFKDDPATVRHPNHQSMGINEWLGLYWGADSIEINRLGGLVSLWQARKRRKKEY